MPPLCMAGSQPPVWPGRQMVEETHCLCGWSSRQHTPRALKGQDPPVNEEAFPLLQYCTHLVLTHFTYMYAHVCALHAMHAQVCTEKSFLFFPYLLI